MKHLKSVTILFFFHCLGLNTFSQSGGNIDFNDFIPSGCINEPILTIGLITDPQYCDCDPAGTRYYRETMWKLPQAIDTMNKYQVDFVMNLGDMIDRYYESYDSVSKHYEKLNMPYYNLIGNHAFEEVADELKSTIVSRYGMPWYYYTYTYDNWRFLVLDGTELAAYSRYIHPDLVEEGDSVWNSVQGMINAETWNGGISKAQQSWMRSEIEEAADSVQNVMLFCHFPAYPDSGDHNLWNDEDIVNLLGQYSNVVAYINGHLHENNYGYQDGIHYYTQTAMLDTPDSSAFAIMRIYPKEIMIQGFGRVPDRIWQYDDFKKKVIQITLSDSILQYSDQKNDITGYLSYASPDSNMMVSFILDTALYHNSYFRISNDSLILNTDEDLSHITDLKVNVIAVDCDGDTFSHTFSLLFDTTVMKFKYLLSDTIISVYEAYEIAVDSLVEDHSKSGMDISLVAITAGVVAFIVTDDTLKIIPQKTGKTEIDLRVYDPFTGKSFHQAFSLEVYDPLNHAPYHKDSLVTDYMIQRNDTTAILLSGIFIDPDGDLPEYSFAVSDTNIISCWLQSDRLFVSGLISGTAIISITANDNRGGLDSVTLHFRVNTSPFHSDTITVEHLMQLNEMRAFHLAGMFHDSDNDSLFFQYALSDSAFLEVSLVSDTLRILGIRPGEANIKVVADDNYGGTDSLFLDIFINSGPLRFKEFTVFIYQFTSECTGIHLDTIFTDPNGDIIKYQVSSTMDSIDVDDTGQLILCPANSGIYKIHLSLDDEKGGLSADSLAIRFNAGPEASQQQYQYTYRSAGEQIILDLDNMFTDPDDDALTFFIAHTDTLSLVYDMLSDVIQLYPQIEDTFDFYVVASDNYGGVDSTNIGLTYQPEINALAENRLIDELKIFPNPSSGILYVQFEAIAEGSPGIRIYDQTGRIVYQSDGLRANQGINHYIINTESIKAKGLWFFTLYMDNGQTIVQRILME